MTANSIFGSYIRFATTQIDDGYPCDTALVRDCIVNNSIHLADEAGQVRVNWMSVTGASLLEGDSTSGYHRVISFGPFPISIRPDGTSYRLRVRARGLRASATTTSVVLAVAPFGEALSAIGVADVNQTAASITAGAGTEGWLSFATDIIYMTNDQVVRARTPVSTPIEFGGTDTTAVTPSLVSLHVFASQASASSATITGVYAAEFVG